MSKFGSILGRKPVLVTDNTVTPVEPAQDAAAAADKSTDALELDQELFFPIANQLGEENEVVRNLLIDAEHKIGELETIKRSIGRLVDPVSKTLRAFEEAKSEKLTLQGVLNSTRIAHAKLREELGTAEKKASKLEAEGVRLREILAIAQQSVSALEVTRTEQVAELATRRAQIADLQRYLQQQATELQIARSENQRCNERVAVADKRVVQLEHDTQAAQQKFELADKERAAVQAMLDKALNDSAQMSRRLFDTEKLLQSTQARLQQVEAAYAEAHAERTRLGTALEEANERHRNYATTQQARFDALQARSLASDRLLEEARDTLAARANEINAFDRRVSEATLTREAIEGRLGQLEAALAERDGRIKDLEEGRVTLAERNEELIKAVSTRENAFYRAQERIQSQDGLVQLLENQLKAARDATELQIEELAAELQRERLERSMAEGALEAGRKDIARLLRDLAALQYRPNGQHLPAAATIPAAYPNAA